MSRVYAIQRQQRWNAQKQELVDAFDLSSSTKYGDLFYLLSPKAAPFNSSSVIRELHSKLTEFTAEDYLLLVGNPCLIGFAVAIAADRTENGEVTLLQWSGKDQSYIPVRAVLFPDNKAGIQDQ